MAEASIWMPPRASQPRASRLAYAGSRRHSRNHATTNLNPRYLVAALPLGALLGLGIWAAERRRAVAAR
jgi:hypothetical protein